MEIISIDRDNIDMEHICCAIGNDKINKKRALSKKEWMKKRFDEGLVFKRFDERGKIFIEYIPIESVWKPISGKNYMVIDCLWVSGRFKGQGAAKELLEECIKDSKSKKKDGVVVVSSIKVKPFLTDKKFYLKHGFEVVDSAFPYFELLVLKFNNEAVNPQFTDSAKTNKYTGEKGFTFVYSNQCPFMEEYVELLSNISKKNKIDCKIIKIQSYKEAQQVGSAFGSLGIYYNGDFLTHELMSEKKFEKFIEKLQ